MRIVELDVHLVELPLRQPWRSTGGTVACTQTLLVRAQDADGVSAWVESCPLGLPTYTPETGATAFGLVAEQLGPLVLGRELDSPAAVATLLAPYRGNSFAQAAVEECWWLLEAQRQGVPLRRLWGGSDAAVALAEGIGRAASLDALVAEVAAAVDRGAVRVKLKIGPGWDWEPVQAVHRAFPKLRLGADANAAYAWPADRPALLRLDACGLAFLEQPLPWRELAEHAQLQAELATPLCLDESVTCVADAERALRLRAGRAICVKPGRVGGLGPALAILKLCREAGWQAWLGGMLESGIGAAINLELATLCPPASAHEIHPCGHWHAESLLAPPLAWAGPGRLAPAAGPGLGREVRADRIAALSRRRWTGRA